MKNSEYRIEHFRPGLTDNEPDDATAQWIQAARLGFNMKDAEAVSLRVMTAGLIADKARMTGTYANSDPRPIGTFATLDGNVNLGGPTPLPASLISWVSVRSTHKRQGILRQMMVDSLQHSADHDLPLALLMASEAGIYGRFGFETVVWGRKISVERAPKFALRSPAQGRVDIVEPSFVLSLIDDIFATFHQQTIGSVSRCKEFYDDLLLTEDTDKPNPALRAAVHCDAADQVDGYVLYQFKGDPPTQSLQVNDLIATNPAAELALWNFLAHTDFVNEITFHSAPVESILTGALVDQRAIKTTGLHDELWARILDPIQVFAARAYTVAARQAGLQLTFRVDDPLGHAAGTFRIALSSEGAEVVRVESSPDVEVSIQGLAALAFGTVCATTLVGAGLLSGTPEAIAVADCLFAAVTPARFHSHF